MRLDHISYAAGPEGLAAAAQRIGSALGAGFRDGGIHPSFGTRNFVRPLSGGVYLEVVEALDHPASDKAAFGRAVRARSAAGGGWLAWVVAVDDIAVVERRLGRPAASGQRHRPDGVRLSWKMIGVLELIDDPALPFFVEWDVPPDLHPAASTDVPIGIAAAEICGDAAKVSRWLGEPLEAADFRFDWTQDEQAGLLAVHFTTPRGVVRID